MAEENIFFGASAARFAFVGLLLADHGVDVSSSSLGAAVEAIVGAAGLPAAGVGDVELVFLLVVLWLVKGRVLVVMVVWCRGEGLVVVVFLTLP
jgi:hypothetical protein